MARDAQAIHINSFIRAISAGIAMTAMDARVTADGGARGGSAVILAGFLGCLVLLLVVGIIPDTGAILSAI